MLGEMLGAVISAHANGASNMDGRRALKPWRSASKLKCGLALDTGERRPISGRGNQTAADFAFAKAFGVDVEEDRIAGDRG